MTFYLPERPYTPIDALNRRAAALGSPGYAQSAEHADYNGHRITVAWNEYRGYYVTEYFWAGRVVLARGDFAHCLDAAVREWRKGALGCSVAISPREEDLDTCLDVPELVKEDDRSWYTWRHAIAAQCARDYANPRALTRLFDWELLQAADDENDYTERVRAKHGRAWIGGAQ